MPRLGAIGIRPVETRCSRGGMPSCGPRSRSRWGAFGVRVAGLLSTAAMTSGRRASIARNKTSSRPGARVTGLGRRAERLPTACGCRVWMMPPDVEGEAGPRNRRRPRLGLQLLAHEAVRTQQGPGGRTASLRAGCERHRWNNRGMPLIDVTYDGSVDEKVLRRLGELLRPLLAKRSNVLRNLRPGRSSQVT
jgi:hypothetical protein